METLVLRVTARKKESNKRTKERKKEQTNEQRKERMKEREEEGKKERIKKKNERKKYTNKQRMKRGVTRSKYWQTKDECAWLIFSETGTYSCRIFVSVNCG